MLASQSYLDSGASIAATKSLNNVNNVHANRKVMSASGHPMEVTAEGENQFGEYDISISVVPSLNIQDNVDIIGNDTRPPAMGPFPTN